MNRITNLRAHAEECLAAARSMSLLRDAERLRQMASYALDEAERLERAAHFAGLASSPDLELARPA